jgi:acid phosphatase type 7
MENQVKHFKEITSRWLIIRFTLTWIVVLCACTPFPQRKIDPLTPTVLSTGPSVHGDQNQKPTNTPTVTQTAIPSSTPTITASPTPEPAVLVGAGDIVECGEPSAGETAALLGEVIHEHPNAQIFTAGDNQYESGSSLEFSKCFVPTWGQFQDRIHPSLGNHEYKTDGAGGYFGYFGQAAGDPNLGYYSYDLGAWHIIALNSNCAYIGGCGPSSLEIKWLRDDLSSHTNKCTLAYWHNPRWSSGLAGSDPGMDTFWRTLKEYNADVVVVGHDHDYERFSPLDASGKPDPDHGVREFVVGTGGGYQRPFNKILPNSEAHVTGVFGVIKFTLYSDRYQWEFIPVPGQAFHDSGSGVCH